MRENAEKLEVLVRTIAMGTLPIFVVATPPTFASAGKSDSFSAVELTVLGDVSESPPTPQAASAASASAAAPYETNSRRFIAPLWSLTRPHGHSCPHVASATSMFFGLIPPI